MEQNRGKGKDTLENRQADYCKATIGTERINPIWIIDQLSEKDEDKRKVTCPVRRLDYQEIGLSPDRIISLG